MQGVAHFRIGRHGRFFLRLFLGSV